MPRLEALGCNAINDGKKGNKCTQSNVASEIEASFKATPHGAEGLERRSDVMNDSVATNVESNDKRNSDSRDRAASASQ